MTGARGVPQLFQRDLRRLLHGDDVPDNAIRLMGSWYLLYPHDDGRPGYQAIKTFPWWEHR